MAQKPGNDDIALSNPVDSDQRRRWYQVVLAGLNHKLGAKMKKKEINSADVQEAPTLDKDGVIVLPSDAKEKVSGFDTGEYPYETKLTSKLYETEKAALQVELLKVQHWVQETGQRFVLLFEGRDAAGNPKWNSAL